jgi:hypothetical protein
MRKLSGAPLLVIPIVIVAAFLLGRIVYYGIGAGAAYTPPDRPLIEVPLSAAPRSERLEAVDNPTDSKGVVVVDYSHGNAFFIEELNTLSLVLSPVVSVMKSRLTPSWSMTIKRTKPW